MAQATSDAGAAAVAQLLQHVRNAAKSGAMAEAHAAAIIGERDLGRVLVRTWNDHRCRFGVCACVHVSGVLEGDDDKRKANLLEMFAQHLEHINAAKAKPITDTPFSRLDVGSVRNIVCTYGAVHRVPRALRHAHSTVA